LEKVKKKFICVPINPLDCLVTAWSSWTQCSSSCNKGVSSRSRKVAQKQLPQGRPCPSLSEKVTCNPAGWQPGCPGVSCGEYRAKNCAACPAKAPKGHEKLWCNGDCAWTMEWRDMKWRGRCLHKDPRISCYVCNQPSERDPGNRGGHVIPPRLQTTTPSTTAITTPPPTTTWFEKTSTKCGDPGQYAYGTMTEVIFWC